MLNSIPVMVLYDPGKSKFCEPSPENTTFPSPSERRVILNPGRPSNDFSPAQGYIPAENCTTSPGFATDNAFRTERNGWSMLPGFVSEAPLPGDTYQTAAIASQLQHNARAKNKHIMDE